MILACVPFTACGASPEEGTVTRMTVDINPSVEFMIDDQNKIVSATALNDDGGILIVGEAFVGKTPEQAIEMTVSLAAETGYLVKGNVTADENTVKISVSGDSRYAKKLSEAVNGKAAAVMETLDIAGKVEKVEAMKIEGLRALALSTSLYTEEEINAMDEATLYKVLAAGRVETAMLLTEEMRRAYYSAKDYKISFAESEETAKVIAAMGGLYTITHTAYKAALDAYSLAITNLDEFRYDKLVSPDSEYQKSLAKLRDAKVELLKQRNYTATLEVGGEQYASATVTLQASEAAYNTALAAYEQLGAALNTSLESLIAILRQSEAQLRQLEATLFDDNIEARLQENASALEAKLNAAKDGFFAEFESAHADDIAAIEQSLLAKKQQLKSEIEAN
jgi:hypothetical protein